MGLDRTDYVKIENNKLVPIKLGTSYLTVKVKENQNITKTIKIRVLHELLEEENSKATQIVGAPGENATTEFNISYSIKNTKSFALITTSDDVDFKNAQKFTGTGYYYEDMREIAGVFEPRNVWKIFAKGLKPDTKYIYKINNGDDTYSDIYHFTTAGGEMTSFIYLTDAHYSMLTDGTDNSSVISEKTIDSALKIQPNASFVLGGGDLIDTGGNENIWNLWFKYAQSLKKLPFIGVPGNHEYYEKVTGQSETNEHFAVHSAGPLNGPSTLLGSSCYFVHNDTLFLMVDNCKSTGYDEQMAWMEYVLANVEYKYSIITFHIPVNFANNPVDYDPKFMKLFDKYCVDLVLSGHYHWNNFTPNYYNEQTSSDPYKGVNYLTGGGAGSKGGNDAKGYIIDIDDNGIKIRFLQADGTILQTYQITSKKNAEKVDASKEEIMNSIKLKEDLETIKTNKTITFEWTTKAYKNVKRIDVKERLRNELNEYSVLPTPSYTDISFNNLVENYMYKFEVIVEFADGTKESKIFDIDLHDSFNLKATDVQKTLAVIELDAQKSILKFEIKEYQIYVNGELVDTINYLDGSSPVTSYILLNLKSGTDYKVEFRAITFKGQIINYETVSFKTL